jgi:hypothetical protein
MLILARCDKAGRVDDPWDRGFTPVGPRDVSAPAESQVIGISGLRAVGYTLGRLLFPWLKKKYSTKGTDET